MGGERVMGLRRDILLATSFSVQSGVTSFSISLSVSPYLTPYLFHFLYLSLSCSHLLICLLPMRLSLLSRSLFPLSLSRFFASPLLSILFLFFLFIFILFLAFIFRFLISFLSCFFLVHLFPSLYSLHPFLTTTIIVLLHHNHLHPYPLYHSC